MDDGKAGTEAIRFENISKSYGKASVLSPMSFSIQRGSFVTLIGSSGCGKTTLLKLCNGLLQSDTGHVYVEGIDTAACSLISLRRSIGYVIQNVGLFPHMTVARNIAYVPRMLRTCTRKEEAALVKEMLELVGLEENMASRYPGELSGGQMQRVGIARALAAKPQILLMDEPFSSVDEITRRKLQRALSRIWQERRITVLFVTHDIREALKLSTRVIVMDKGCIQQDGSPEEIRNAPATEFVRQLVSDTI